VARLIIDGYNVMGTLHRDLRAQREKFLRELLQYQHRRGHHITVVFDAAGGVHHELQRQVHGALEVLYSRSNESADAVIKRLLQKHPGAILVSSDRELVAWAWAHQAVPVPAEAFLRRLRQPQEEPLPQPQEEPARPRKGSPRKPSRKERAQQRALRKL